MIAEAGAAISSIKVAMDMAKGIAALKSEAEVNQAVIEIQRTLLEAQQSAFEDKQRIDALITENTQLNRALLEARNWEDDAKRYVLTESDFGTFSYELKPEFADSEVAHRLCVTCFGNGKKAVLQGRNRAECNTCGATIRLNAPRGSTVQIDDGLGRDSWMRR